MVNKIKSLPCIFEKTSEKSMAGLVKGKIRVMHEGDNRNNTGFKEDAMKKAEESIKNRPVLAFIKYDGDENPEDFGGHERILKTVKTEDGKETFVYYLEKPIGLIPESCNPRYEVVDNVSHFVADCFIWEEYCNEALMLINDADGGKQVSMEIDINDYYMREDGVIQITDYTYKAVTVLGDDVIQGMNGTAKIELYESQDELIFEFAEKITEQIREFNEKEGEKMKLFGMGVDEIFRLISNELSSEKIEDKWGYEYSKYYIADLDLSEKRVVLYDRETGKFMGVSFNLNETSISLDLSTAKEYVSVWVERSVDEDFSLSQKFYENFKKEDELKFEKYESALKEIEGYENTIEELNSSISEFNEKIKDLEDYKSNKELESERIEMEKNMNEIDSDFSFDEKELSEIKEKVFNKEITLDEYKKELFVLEGMKSIELKKQSQKGNNINYTLDDINKSKDFEKIAKEKEAFGGLFANIIE